MLDILTSEFGMTNIRCMGYTLLAENPAKILSAVRPRRKDKSTLRLIRYSPGELKRIRKEFRVKQQEIADFIGVSRSMISLWETERKDEPDEGKRAVVEEPGLKRLKQMGRFFSQKAGYKVAFWADPDDEEEQNQSAPEYWGRQ